MAHTADKEVVRGRSSGLVLLLLCLLVPLDTWAGNLYRYKNNHGILVLDDRIPPAYVNGGYEVLSKSGRVLKVVPPYTEKEVGNSQQDAEASLQREKDDRYLLATYRSLEEIQHARARRLSQLEREIQIVETNLADTRARRESELAKAASFQASGRDVPETVRDALAGLEQEESKARDMLVARQQEHQALDKRFEGYESRFLELTDKKARVSDAGIAGN